MFRSIFRLLSLAGTIAAAVLFAFGASKSVWDTNGDIGWGLFCLAVGIAARYLEGGIPYVLTIEE